MQKMQRHKECQTQHFYHTWHTSLVYMYKMFFSFIMKETLLLILAISMAQNAKCDYIVHSDNDDRVDWHRGVFDFILWILLFSLLLATVLCVCSCTDATEPNYSEMINRDPVIHVHIHRSDIEQSESRGI